MAASACKHACRDGGVLGARTTATLDLDVAAALQRAARERGASFKEVLNDAIRRGLAGEPVIAHTRR